MDIENKYALRVAIMKRTHIGLVGNLKISARCISMNTTLKSKSAPQHTDSELAIVTRNKYTVNISFESTRPTVHNGSTQKVHAAVKKTCKLT
jgi:hypothetical protein